MNVELVHRPGEAGFRFKGTASLGSSYEYRPPSPHEWERYMQRIAEQHTFDESVEQMQRMAFALIAKHGHPLPVPRLMVFTHEPKTKVMAWEPPSSRSYFSATFGKNLFVEFREKETVGRFGPAPFHGAEAGLALMALHSIYLDQNQPK